MADPGRGLERGALPERPREQPDDEVGAGAAEADRVEARLRQARRTALEQRRMVLPRRHRIVHVEPHRRADRVPQPLDVGLAEDHLGPAGVGRGDDRPVDEALHHERQVDRARVVRVRPGDERRVEPGEEVGIRVAGQLDDRGARLAPAAHPVQDVLRRLPELLVRAELDGGAAEMQVGDDRQHATGAGREGGARDRSCDLRVLDEVDQDDVLALLHVGADADRQLGEALEAFVGGHRRGILADRGAVGSATRPSRSRASGPRGPRPAPRPRASRPRARRPRRATAGRATPRAPAHRRASPRGVPAPRS